MNVGGNVFGNRGYLIGLTSVDAYHIVFKSDVINIAALEAFIQM